MVRNSHSNITSKVQDFCLQLQYGASKVSLCTLRDVIPADQDIIACIGLEELFFGESMTKTSFFELQEFVRHLQDQRVLWVTTHASRSSVQTLDLLRLWAWLALSGPSSAFFSSL